MYGLIIVALRSHKIIVSYGVRISVVRIEKKHQFLDFPRRNFQAAGAMDLLRSTARATRAFGAPSPPPFSSSEREYSYPLPAPLALDAIGTLTGAEMRAYLVEMRRVHSDAVPTIGASGSERRAALLRWFTDYPAIFLAPPAPVL